MWSASVEAHESTPSLARVARPLACSVALHLGLLPLLVVAGSAALAPLPAARVAWLDLQPAEIAPPPGPAPVEAPPRDPVQLLAQWSSRARFTCRSPTSPWRHRPKRRRRLPGR